MAKKKTTKSDQEEALEVYRISMIDGYAQAIKVIENAISWTAKYQAEQTTPGWIADDLEELLEILEQIQS